MSYCCTCQLMLLKCFNCTVSISEYWNEEVIWAKRRYDSQSRCKLWLDKGFNSCLRQIRMCDNENLAEKHIVELNFRVCQGKWCQWRASNAPSTRQRGRSGCSSQQWLLKALSYLQSTHFWRKHMHLYLIIFMCMYIHPYINMKSILGSTVQWNAFQCDREVGSW